MLEGSRPVRGAWLCPRAAKKISAALPAADVLVELDLVLQNERDVEHLRASPDRELNLGARLFGAQALTRIRKLRVSRRTAIYQSYQVSNRETHLRGGAPRGDVHDFVTIAVGIDPKAGAIERADVGGHGLDAFQIHELAGVVAGNCCGVGQ